MVAIVEQEKLHIVLVLVHGVHESRHIHNVLMMHVSFHLIFWHPQCSDTPRLPDWRKSHGSNAQRKSSIFFQMFFNVAWNQHDWGSELCVCMFTYSVLYYVDSLAKCCLSELTIRKVCQLARLSQCRMQQRPSEGKQRHVAHVAMTRDTSKVVVGKWMKDQRARNCG